MQRQSISSRNSQEGAVLVVALVILLIMTLLGVSNMQSSALQIKMVNNTQARQQAFEAAEAALVKVETQLFENGHNPADVQGCAPGDAECFDVTCAGGLCFNGTYGIGAFENTCALSTTVAEPYWSNTTLDVWNTATRHKTVAIDADGDLPEVQYIVEFMCYIDKNPAPAPTCADHNENCAPLYRITALAKSPDEKAEVMLQSTYRITEI